MEARNAMKRIASVTPLRHVRFRLGRAVRGSGRAPDIFGWPCSLVLALDDGRLAYVLDFERATRAPVQLRFPLERGAIDAWLSGQAVRVMVQSIFGELIVVGVEGSGGGYEPSGALACSEAA